MSNVTLTGVDKVKDSAIAEDTAAIDTDAEPKKVRTAKKKTTAVKKKTAIVTKDNQEDKRRETLKSKWPPRIRIYSCKYEIFGKVQRVHFREHAAKVAEKYGVTGWIQNTSNHTVKGIIEGEENAVKQMKIWLENVGSPRSKITKAEFTPVLEMPWKSYLKFTVRKI